MTDDAKMEYARSTLLASNWVTPCHMTGPRRLLKRRKLSCVNEFRTICLTHKESYIGISNFDLYGIPTWINNLLQANKLLNSLQRICGCFYLKENMLCPVPTK